MITLFFNCNHFSVSVMNSKDVLEKCRLLATHKQPKRKKFFFLFLLKKFVFNLKNFRIIFRCKLLQCLMNMCPVLKSIMNCEKRRKSTENVKTESAVIMANVTKAIENLQEVVLQGYW